MRSSPLRLEALLYAVEREALYLEQTDGRLFAMPFDEQRAMALPADQDLSELVDAFAMRFGRLQDTLGDKLIPAVLQREQEPLGSALDNLDRAERLGWVDSVDSWIDARRLRNGFVHEYLRDPAKLAYNLMQGHSAVPLLVSCARRLLAHCQARGWHVQASG